MTQTKAAAFFPTMEKARAAIQEVIGALTSMDFAHTVTEQDADVYGPDWQAKQWYLKVTIPERSQLLVISMHPANGPLETNRARQAKKGKVRR